MPRRPDPKRDLLYWRKDRGVWYADLRTLGLGQRSTGTADRTEAALKLAEWVRTSDGVRSDSPRLKDYTERHLRFKERTRRPATIDRDQRSLRTVRSYFGEHVRLVDLTVARLAEYVAAREDAGASAQTVLHELHALSSLFRRAVAEGQVSSNPVALLPDRPRIRRPEPVWLEVDEAARLLKASRGWFRRLIATFLLTGGRRSEVFGLLGTDIDLGLRCVHFRPNEYRELKRDHHVRRVPLFEQLREELDGWRYVGTEGLLFPGRRGNMLTDVRGSLQTAVDRAQIRKQVTLHTLRHTFAAVRIQTLDRGAPISPFKVMRELGHRSLSLIERTYGHLLRGPSLKVMMYVEDLEMLEIDLEENDAGVAERQTQRA